MSYACDDCGKEGVCSTSFSFSVPSAEYDDTVGLYPAGAKVELTCSNGMIVPRFYVIGRSPGDGRITINCYDRCYRVDRKIDLTESDFESSAYISAAELMAHICSVCGFTGYSDSSSAIAALDKQHKNNILDRSCRDILSDLSRSCAGYWVMQGDTSDGDLSGTIALIPLGGGSGSAVFSADKHTDVVLGGTRTFKTVIITNGDKTYIAGSGSNAYDTLEIDTPYTSDSLAGVLYDRLKDYTYRSWQCGKMLCGAEYPAPSALISFSDGHSDMLVNKCDMTFTASGIYASVGSNAVTAEELNYVSSVQRELSKRLQLNTKYKTVYVNENKGLGYCDGDNVINSDTEAKEAGLITDSTDGSYFKVSLGDGLFWDGDIECKYEIQGKMSLANGIRYDYGKYYVTVTYDESDGERKNPHWTRTYKEATAS